MSYHEAICILNAVRSGRSQHITSAIITVALRLTGDIDEGRNSKNIWSTWCGWRVCRAPWARRGIGQCAWTK